MPSITDDYPLRVATYRTAKAKALSPAFLLDMGGGGKRSWVVTLFDGVRTLL